MRDNARGDGAAPGHINGEADLMGAPCPAHLGGEAVGDPDVGAVLAEEVGDHVLAAARPDREAAVPAMVEHQVHQVRLPTRTLVSSDCRIVLDNRRSRIRSASCPKAARLSARMLTRAPSLIAAPSRSDISRDSRSNEIAWVTRR